MNQSHPQTPTLSVDADPLNLFLGSLDRPGFWLDNGLRCTQLFVGYIFVHMLLVLAGDLLVLQPNNVVVFWPAAGLLCGVLACTPVRTWPLWLVAAVVGRVTVEMVLIDGRNPAAPVLFTAAGAIEAMMFAAFIRKPLEQSLKLERPLYLLAAFVVVALSATALGGLLGSTLVDMLFTDAGGFWQNWRVWVSADFLGILVVTPAVVWLLLPQLRYAQRASQLMEYASLAAVTLGLAALALYVLVSDSEPPSNAVTALFALFAGVPLFWAALRFAYPVAAIVQVVFIVTAITVSARTHGATTQPFDEYLSNLAAMQIYLIAAMLFVLLFAFMLVERLRAANELHLHRGLGSVLVALTERLVTADYPDVDDSIDDVLCEIASFARADRCVLLQMQRGSLTVTATHTWTRDGVGEHPEQLRNADLSRLPWVMQQFRERGYVAVDNFSAELPEGAEELREIQKAAPTTYAAVYVGLFTDGELIGAIGCGYARPGVRWSSESLSLMFLVGQLFANVLKRKNTERALDQYRHKLRSLAAEVTMSEERARRRTATDLHDGIGQNLAVARMKVGQLLATTDGGRDELNALRGLIDDALRGTRHIISDLSPAILYELGLVPALQSLAERFETSNDLTCTLEETGEAWSPVADMRITVYRSVQELLNNVARHAKAGNVSITVAWSADSVEIVVSDDGIGLDTSQVSEFSPPASGFGLFSVREGIELLGGTLELDSGRGIGTTARLRVPRRDEEGDE